MSIGSEDPNSLRNEVFSRFFDENWAAVRHHIEGVVADDAEVSELVSQVFLVAWSRLHVKRPMGRIWLLRRADRILSDRARKPATRHTVADAVLDGVSGDSAGPDLDCRADVVKAIAGLSARERRIIMLTYWDGLSAGEIAELMRSSRSRVRRTLGRAQAGLRTELGLEGANGHG